MGPLDCLFQKFPFFRDQGKGRNSSRQLQMQKNKSGKKNIPLSRAWRQSLKQARPLPCLSIPGWLCSGATQQASRLTDQQSCPESMGEHGEES